MRDILISSASRNSFAAHGHHARRSPTRIASASSERYFSQVKHQVQPVTLTNARNLRSGSLHVLNFSESPWMVVHWLDTGHKLPHDILMNCETEVYDNFLEFP